MKEINIISNDAAESLKQLDQVIKFDNVILSNYKLFCIKKESIKFLISSMCSV
jgi:hypothetical protein